MNSAKQNTDVKPVPEGMHTVTPHLVCDGAANADAWTEWKADAWLYQNW